MKMVATTLRIEENLKKAAEQRALDLGISFQALFNRALESYLQSDSQEHAKKIVFLAQDLGMPLDNLTRDDFYAG